LPKLKAPSKANEKMTGVAYRIEYMFFEKEIIMKSDSKGAEEGSYESSESGESSCKAAHITQELILIDRKVMKKRIRNF
jgi:hypothetical protein